jgi:hypothetical protein
MGFEKHDKAVMLFHFLGSPHIFVFSSVGSVGLNMSIANVVIFFIKHPFIS